MRNLKLKASNLTSAEILSTTQLKSALRSTMGGEDGFVCNCSDGRSTIVGYCGDMQGCYETCRDWCGA